jgi:quinol-cytochrome oxidoreductase complex cytochrome b subunit
MLKAIGLLFAAGGVIYFLFYPFLKNKVNRKKTFKWFIIIYVIVAVASTVGNYLMKEDRVEKMSEGVEDNQEVK